jgi:hypothetical protein
VTLPGAGPLSQQHGRQQQQGHDTLEHGTSCFNNTPPSSLTEMPVRSIPPGLAVLRARRRAASAGPLGKPARPAPCVGRRIPTHEDARPLQTPSRGNRSGIGAAPLVVSTFPARA